MLCGSLQSQWGNQAEVPNDSSSEPQLQADSVEQFFVFPFATLRLKTLHHRKRREAMIDRRSFMATSLALAGSG